MFTPAVLSTTIPALLAGIFAVVTTWMTHRNRQDVKRVESKVEPVSNGFSKAVLDSLSELKADMQEVKSEQALMKTVIAQILDDTPHVRRRTRKTTLKGAA